MVNYSDNKTQEKWILQNISGSILQLHCCHEVGCIYFAQHLLKWKLYLYNNAVNSSDYTVTKGRSINKQKMVWKEAAMLHATIPAFTYRDSGKWLLLFQTLQIYSRAYIKTARTF